MNTGIPSINSRVSSVASVVKTDKSPTQEASNTTSAAKAKDVLPTINDDRTARTEAATKAEKPTLQEVIDISERLNNSVQKIQRDINFSVDETLGEIVVKVVDRETQETIRQIPSEEMLSLSRNIEEITSLLFDKIEA